MNAFFWLVPEKAGGVEACGFRCVAEKAPSVVDAPDAGGTATCGGIALGFELLGDEPLGKSVSGLLVDAVVASGLCEGCDDEPGVLFDGLA